MTAFSRREFGKAVAAAVPLATLAGSRGIFAAAGLTVGVSTSSFRDLPRQLGAANIVDVINALDAVHATHIELSMTNVEPAPPSTGPRMGGSPAYPQLVVLSPQQIAAINAMARENLRSWRARTGGEYFANIKDKFKASGVTVHACALDYDASFTDEEIDGTFRQVKAMGVSTISSPMTMATAVRLVPFAKAHQMSIAIHNQVDGNAANAIATPHLEEALSLSPAFSLKLDVGNLTASNADPVAVLRKHQPRVSFVLVKDRLRNGGVSQPFGEGDTPIPAVVGALKASPAIPLIVEYDYVGVRASVDEVAASVAYVTQALK